MSVKWPIRAVGGSAAKNSDRCKWSFEVLFGNQVTSAALISYSWSGCVAVRLLATSFLSLLSGSLCELLLLARGHVFPRQVLVLASPQPPLRPDNNL